MEGFRPQDAVTAILNGSIIERRLDHARCLICGRADGIRDDRRFHGDFIHCAIRYDNITRLIVITMYRPRVDVWEHTFRRRYSTS